VAPQLHVLRDLPPLPALGLALVRSVDSARGLFYLLTPVPVDKLLSVRVLVAGALALPGIAVYQVRTRARELSLAGAERRPRV
jgi:hypothetical protein